MFLSPPTGLQDSRQSLRIGQSHAPEINSRKDIRLVRLFIVGLSGASGEIQTCYDVNVDLSSVLTIRVVTRPRRNRCPHAPDEFISGHQPWGTDGADKQCLKSTGRQPLCRRAQGFRSSGIHFLVQSRVIKILKSKVYYNMHPSSYLVTNLIGYLPALYI